MLQQEKFHLVEKGYGQDVLWLMVEDFNKEKLGKMERSKVQTSLYITIVEVEKAYEHVSEEFELLLSVILPQIEVVATIVSFLFLFVQ